MADNDGKSPIFLLAKNNVVNKEMISVLVENGATQLSETLIGNCENDCPSIEIMGYLLDKKANISFRDETNDNGRSKKMKRFFFFIKFFSIFFFFNILVALSYLCGNKGVELELVSFLVDRGSSVNAIDCKGESPLHYLCANEVLKIEVLQVKF